MHVYLAILFGGMPRMYKITVSKGDIRKHAKSMPNVSGIFSLPAEFVN